MKSHHVVAIFHLILTPFLVVLKGYVFTRLWLWFAVETFGAQPLGTLQASGLLLLVGYCVYQFRSSRPTKDDDEKESRAVELLSMSITYPLVCWGFGAVIHAFM